MACRGVYFALSEEEESRLLGAKSDQELVSIIQEEIEERWDKEWLQETDKAWDAIHRCLTNGSLKCNGRTVFEKMVIGGKQLHQGSDYIVSYLAPKEVSEVAEAVRTVTKDWFRERYFGLKGRFFGLFSASDYDGPIDENDFDYSWSYFEQIRELFEKAAAGKRSMIFTVDP